MKNAIVVLLMLAAWIPLNAQSSQSEHILKLDDPSNRPPATIDRVTWLQGHWKGESLGGVSEEIWSPPAGGAMMGVFRHIREGRVVFYEMITLLEEEGSLMLRLKHFNADLTGWEEQNETVDFPLVKIDEEAAWFDGMTIRRLGEDEIVIYVLLESGEGTTREGVFPYRRAGPAGSGE